MDSYKKYFAVIFLAVLAAVVFLILGDNRASTKVKVSQAPAPSTIISEENVPTDSGVMEGNMEKLKN